MNRPHVAALLRVVAGEASAAAYKLTSDNPTDAEAKRIISETVERLRARAGEIEAG